MGDLDELAEHVQKTNKPSTAPAGTLYRRARSGKPLPSLPQNQMLWIVLGVGAGLLLIIYILIAAFDSEPPRPPAYQYTPPEHKNTDPNRSIFEMN